MAETTETKGVEKEKYSFFVPEDPKVAKEMEGKAWNHRKLKKIILNDYVLTYHEILQMKMIFESNLETAKRDLEILKEKIEANEKRIEDEEANVLKWSDEAKMAEKDIPEIGEKAKAERDYDAEKQKKHADNLAGKGEGRALEVNEDGKLEDKTGSKA